MTTHCLRVRVPRRLVLLALSLAVPAAAVWGQTGAQQNPAKPKAARSDTLVVHHPSKTATLIGKDGPSSRIRNGDNVRVGKDTRLIIDSTNSALYDCKVDQTAIAVPELDSLKAFLTQLGPYLPVLGAAAAGPVLFIHKESNDRLKSLRKALARLDSLVHGPGGLDEVRAVATAALERMRLDQSVVDPSHIKRLQEALVDSCLPAVSGCRALRHAGEIGATLDLIISLRHALVGERLELEDKQKAHEAERAPVAAKVAAITAAILIALESEKPALRDQLRKEQPELDRLNQQGAPIYASLNALKPVLEGADKALAEADKVLTAAYAVEALAIRTVNAKSTIECDPVSVSWDSGKAVTIKVTPATAPELARIASRPPLEFKANVLPNWGIRPALGVSFLVAPQARYPGYSAKAAGSQFVIEKKEGSQDARFTYGLTLGLTYDGVDRRDGSGAALWLPEITINPSSDVKAMGIGAGVSYHILKLGGGLLWSKHSVLDGQNEGDALATAALLATRSGYGRGKWYVSLSLIGLPPFARSK